MEKFECNAETAAAILEAGNRKITICDGSRVVSFNLNNDTCKTEFRGSSIWRDIENVKFFINVPRNAKTVY